MACQETFTPPRPRTLTPRIPAVSMRGMTEERAPRTWAADTSATYKGTAIAKAPLDRPEDITMSD